MVKFLGRSDNGRAVVGLGLSRLNVTRLLAGMPIRVSLDAQPPTGLGMPVAIDIVIVGGETEETIAAEIQAATQRRQPT